MKQRPPVCDKPTVFEFDTDVCGGCGNLIAAHTTRPGMDTYQRANEAMWRVMFAFGAPYNLYHGRPLPELAAPVLEHLAKCAIDWKRTEQPTMQDKAVFENTYTDDATVHLLSGDLYCMCGAYTYLSWAVDDMTLGQLIWHTVHDEPPPDSHPSGLTP